MADRGAARMLVLALSVFFCLAAAGQEIRLRLAEIQPDDHPTAKADYEFARLVGLRSGGRIRISVYTDSVLGQEMDVLEQLRFGAIDIARVSVAAVSSYVPELDALQMPYLYRGEAQMWRVLKGPIGKELLASVESAGFVGLGWFEAGARDFYNSSKIVRRPSDLEGLRIRVQEGGVTSDIVSSFGAQPVPLAFGAAYAAILRGTIDGAENNIPTYFTSGHYRIARYFTLTEHTRIPEIIVGSAVSFSELSRADRDLIAQAAMDTIDFQREAWRSYEALATEKLRAAGVSIVPASDIDSWRALVRPIYEAQSPATRALIARIRSTD